MRIKQLSKFYRITSSSLDTNGYVCKVKTDIPNTIPILFIFLNAQDNTKLESIAIPHLREDDTEERRIDGFKSNWAYISSHESEQAVLDEVKDMLSNEIIDLKQKYGWFFIYES